MLTYVDRGGCDFFGFNKHGAHIAIEAKTLDRPSLPIWVDGKGSGVKVHQMQHLREAAKAGGFGLIVWKRGDQVTILDTWPLVPEIGKSISMNDTQWAPIGILADRLEEVLNSD